MKRDLHILVSNDDGYQAPGLLCLVAALSELAEVTVVAPDRDRSGASNSLSLKNPLYVTRHANGFYSVEGTPTDCVHLAITGLLEQEPDMVISGINHGANLGDDVIYSGTVAAAMEGRFLGLPAIAISQASFEPLHLDTAARVAVWLVRRLQERPLPPDTILNVNVPDRPWEQLTQKRRPAGPDHLLGGTLRSRTGCWSGHRFLRIARQSGLDHALAGRFNPPWRSWPTGGVVKLHCNINSENPKSSVSPDSRLSRREKHIIVQYLESGARITLTRRSRSGSKLLRQSSFSSTSLDSVDKIKTPIKTRPASIRSPPSEACRGG